MTGSRNLGYVLEQFPRISETFIAAELLELRRQGERVTVFTLSRPDEAFTHAFLDELDVPIVYLPNRTAWQPLRSLRALAWVLHTSPRAWLAALRVALEREGRFPSLRRMCRLVQACVLVRELQRAGVEHVHAHFATTAARLANLAWRMGGPPYSVTAHARDIYHRVDKRRERLREKLDQARFVATVCEANRRHLERELGVMSPIRVVPNSVDIRRLPAPHDWSPERGLVLSVARLVEKKGLDDLVRACGLLTRRGLRPRLEVIGDGPLRAALERLARAEGIEVKFVGSLPHEQVVEQYRRAAVFALPCVVTALGDRDGLPTAVLEAMAAGVPVVTTAVTGLGELVKHERSGLVVAERDPAALANAIGRVLTEPELAQRLARNGRQRIVEQHDLRRSVESLRRLFAGTAA